MKRIVILAAMFAAATVLAADKIAVAEPKVSRNFSHDDALAIWDEIEESIKSTEYEVVTRAALKDMMTEIGLTTSSDLVDVNSTQKAQLGKLKGVKYLLLPSLRKLGSTITLSMRVVDASTGVIDQDRTAQVKSKSLDEIADKIAVTVKDLLKDDKAPSSCALLTPVINMSAPPPYLQGDFNTWVQSALLANGIRLANLADVSRFQKAGLTQMTDTDYAVLGRKLRVKYLIQTEITNFAITAVPWSSPETGASGYIYYGQISARMKVVDANDGSLRDAVPIEWSKELGRSGGMQPASLGDTYGKNMIAEIVTQTVVPRLAAIPGIK